MECYMDKERIKLITEIARLYYENGKTQEEIGEMLGISRISVLRLLNKAREEGIVSIKVVDLLSTNRELERELEREFRLEKAIVVYSDHLPKPLILRELGKWGSLLLQETVQDGDILGIGWGTTMFECARNLNSSEKKNVIAVPLGGGNGQVDPNFQVNEITRKIANKFKAKWYPLDIPIFVENKNTKYALFNEPKVMKVIDLWDRLSIAVVGIGDIASLWEERSSLIALSQEAAEILKEELVLYGSVGNIALNYFNINGNISPISIRENIITISLEQLKRAKRVIALSGGEDKKEAVLGALRWGYITHLVTDESVAKYLLEISSKLETGMSLTYK